MVKTFTHSFESAEETKEFIANSSDVHSVEVYVNDNPVHLTETQPEPVAVVEPTPAPVVEVPAPEVAPAPVVEAPVVTETPAA